MISLTNAPIIHIMLYVLIVRIMIGGEMQAQFVTAQEVAEIMGVSRSKAYQIVREMNRELKSMGYITVSGKCPVQYFKKKFYGLQIGGDAI